VEQESQQRAETNANGDRIEQEGTEGTEEFKQEQRSGEQAEQEEGAEQRPVLKEARNAAWGHAKESRESAVCRTCSYCVCHTGSTMRLQRTFMQLPHFAPF
jgi:hypothetical protein